MRRKRPSRIAQAAQIDDALHPGAFRRRTKIAGGCHVAFGKVGTRSKAVHEIISGCDPAHGIRAATLDEEHRPPPTRPWAAMLSPAIWRHRAPGIARWRPPRAASGQAVRRCIR